MKKITIIITTFLFVFSSYGQIEDIRKLYVLPTVRTNEITPLNCILNVVNTNCNLIQNGTFIPNITSFDETKPFNLNQVPNWVTSHGSPMIYVPNPITNLSTYFPPPPLGISSYAMCYTGITNSNNPLIQNIDNHEGIAQKVKQFVAGDSYQLTFQEMVIPFSVLTNDVTDVRIVLMNCSDFNAIQSDEYNLPNIPVNSQTIYCETGAIENPNWTKRAINFTANSNYDVIVIYPIVTLSQNPIAELWYLVTDLQLTKANSILVNMNINNCNINVTPSCILKNYIYTWTGPNNQILTGNSVNIDASVGINQGTWTVTTSSTSPVISSNNTCSTNGYVPMQASFVINSCTQPCINLPLIQ